MERRGNKVLSSMELLMGFAGLIGILIITAGVVSRFILKVSISWTDELLRTLFIYGYFIGAALAYYRGGLMRLELLEVFLKNKGKTGLERGVKILASATTGVFLLFLIYGVFRIIMPFILGGTTTSTSKTPAWVLPMGYAIGIVMMLMVVVVNLYRERSRKPA